jgi:hypothetical protein
VTLRDDNDLPPLPEEIRSAISKLRDERPSPFQEQRISAALEAAEIRRNLPRQWGTQRASRPRNWRLGLWGVGAMLASAAFVMVEQSEDRRTAHARREARPLREVPVLIPEGGGWVSLPWTLDQHPEGMARVHLETPAELDFHRHSSHLPAVQLVSCEADRCMHQFTADAGDDAEPLRVRIHRPGEYVFHVSHASDARHIAESFLVRAGQ